VRCEHPKIDCEQTCPRRPIQPTMARFAQNEAGARAVKISERQGEYVLAPAILALVEDARRRTGHDAG
jgi:hypothetical protein